MLRVVAVPRSSRYRRQPKAWCKILSRIDPESETGFGWEGRIVSSGASAELELPPSQRAVIVLECAGDVHPGARGHNRVEQLYVLWRYDLQTEAWSEVARALSVSWHWALELRPMALRALREARGLQLIPSLPDALARIELVLENELQPFDLLDRVRLLAGLHDICAARTARIPSSIEEAG